MGVIQRQSLKFTIVNGVGTFIGFLSVVFIYSLDKSLYGYFQSVFSYASLLTALLGLGIQGAIIKFHPRFLQRGMARHFLVFTLLLALGCSVVSLGVLGTLYTLLLPWFRSLFSNFTLVEENLAPILILSFLLLFSSIITHHAMARFRIVIPDIVLNIGLKLTLPLLIVLVYFGYLSANAFMPLILVYFTFVMIVLLMYLLSLDTFSISPAFGQVGRSEYRSLFSFMVFSILNNLGAILALKMDLAMIGMMISKEAVGVYAIIMTITNVMEIPLKSLGQIAGPVVSSSWASGDKRNIQDIYQKSSLYGFMAGVYLFLLLYSIWPDILRLMPGKMGSLQEVLLLFIFLAGARLIDLITGVNSVILAYSDQYRFHMYFLIVLGVVNAVLNYFLIGQYGIVGAAAATFFSYLVFNGLKAAYVWKRFGFFLGLQAHFAVFCMALPVFFLIYALSLDWHPIVNMMIKGSIITLVLGGLYWVSNTGDIRSIARQALPWKM